MDCVDVCPVDCFYEGKNMLVIKPDECIDCGVCEPECPVDAIVPDTAEGSEKWLEMNTKYSEIWPNISEKKDPPADHKKYENEEDKFKKYSEIWPNISEKKDPPTDHEKFRNEQNKYEKYFKENL